MENSSNGHVCHSPQHASSPVYVSSSSTNSVTCGTFQGFRLVSQIFVLLLNHYYRYMTEHPELRKGRRHLFIPFKDNNTGKELSVASISHWICTTIVDSHATLQNIKIIPAMVKKAHKVCAVATSLQLFKTSRPTSSHEGRQMVRWRHLHVLLP